MALYTSHRVRGASRGSSVFTRISPVSGATRNGLLLHQLFCPPLAGLVAGYPLYPRLASWAFVWRRSAACSHGQIEPLAGRPSEGKHASQDSRHCANQIRSCALRCEPPRPCPVALERIFVTQLYEEPTSTPAMSRSRLACEKSLRSSCPASPPSRITRIRRLRFMISGSSDEMTSSAMPWQASSSSS